MSKKVQFNADMNIEKVLELDESVKALFKELGLKCADCVAAEKETLRHAALYHEQDLENILHQLTRLKIKPKE